MGSSAKLWFFFSSRRRHTRWNCDWSSDVCSSDLEEDSGDHGLGRSRTAATSAGGKNPKNGNLRRDRLELFERSILVDRDVRPGPGHAPQVGLQHRRPLLDRELFELNVLGTTVTQDRAARG